MIFLIGLAVKRFLNDKIKFCIANVLLSQLDDAIHVIGACYLCKICVIFIEFVCLFRQFICLFVLLLIMISSFSLNHYDVYKDSVIIFI